MTDLPQPLTPADCDLRGLPFMPLDVIRLLDSDMFAEATGDEFKAAVALWCKSWTQIPAASLPNKDVVLARLSGSDKWRRVKAGAMRGWILCSDDRWYHPVVAEKALAALPGREEYNSKKSAEAERKARERDDRKALFELLKRHGIVPEWNISTKVLRGMAVQYQSQDLLDHVTDSERDMSQPVTVSKREREIKGERELTSKAESGGTSVPDREPDDDRLPPRPTHPPVDPSMRAVAITTLLSGAGVRKVTAFHPDVAVTWAQDERVTDTLLLAAVARAKESLGAEPFQVAYLRPIIVELLNPPISRPKANDHAWRRTPAGIEAKGRELRMMARGGESHDAFAGRLQVEIEKRKGAKP